MSTLQSFLRGAAKVTYSNASSGLTAVTVQAAIDELDLSLDGAIADIADIRTLTGTADGETNLGTFTGSTIADNSSVKAALQALETAHEEVDANVNDLITLSGVAENSTDLGTFTGSTITDANTNKGALQELETAVELRALDADVIKKDGSVAFTADQDMGGFKLTGLAEPTLATDAATKGYVDSSNAGLDPKESVRVATTGNITLATAPSAIDGVTLANGDRVLVKDQTTQTENGIYDFNGAGSAMTRSADQDGSPAAEVSSGNYTFVEQGSTHANAGFSLTGDGILTLGVDNIIWTQFNGAGSFNAGDGLSQSGSTINVNVDDSSIEINADILRVKALGIKDSMIDFGTGAGQVSAADLPIADGGGIITATDVEGALQENRLAIDALEDNTITSPNGSMSVAGTVGGDDQTIDVVFSTTGTANRSIEASALASTANGEGASMIGLEDAGGLITATTVEGALAENRTAIDAIEDNGITSSNGSISATGTIGADNLQVDVAFSTSGAANRSIEAQALASTTNGEGASMVGVEDAAGNWTSTDVEGVLVEVDSRLDVLESGGTADWSLITTNTTAADGDKYLVDTSGGAVTVTLPASPSAGDEVILRDAKRTSETNAITVARNSENIGGLAEDLSIDLNGYQVHLVYVDASHGWSVAAA